MQGRGRFFGAYSPRGDLSRGRRPTVAGVVGVALTHGVRGAGARARAGACGRIGGAGGRGRAKGQKIRAGGLKSDPPCENNVTSPARGQRVKRHGTQSPYTPVIEMLPWGVVRQVAMYFG